MIYDIKQHQRFTFVVHIILKDYNKELDEFEYKALKLAQKEIGRLTDSQVAVLNKIVKRFFTL